MLVSVIFKSMLEASHEELEQCFCPNNKCKDYGLTTKATSLPRQVRKGQKPRPSILPALVANVLPPHKPRVVRFASPSRDDQTNYPPCRRRRWCQGNREIAWTEQGHRQPGDPSCWRTLRSCAFKPAESLELKETQLDELWTFVKKRNVLVAKETLSASTDKPGSGRPSTPF